jgi:fluoride exporter
MTVALWAWPLIGLIGAAGAVLRVSVDTAVAERTSGRFPYGTLAVNMTGTAALGLIHGLGWGGNVALLVGAAGLGSYTTFSTLVYETERLLEDGDRLAAAANLLGSMALGFAVVVGAWWLGVWL